MKKIMLHIRDTTNIGGPNVSNELIYNSYLNKKFKFQYLKHPVPRGLIGNIMLIPNLIKQILTFKPDIVHVIGLSRIGFEGVIAARLCGKKVLLTIHGSTTDAINFNKKKLYQYIIEPITMRLAHKVYAVANSMSNRAFVKKHSGERLLETLHNSAPLVELDKIADFELRKRYNIDKEKAVVAIVGRVTYDKGIRYVIESIRRNNNENIVYVFVGDGPLLEVLKNELSDRIAENKVILLGKQKDVLAILKECDIFLFATLHENLSNALLEACTMGLAVVATNVGGNPEVIRHGVNGLLIPPSNVDEIINAINDLTDNNILRERFSLNARKTILEEFSQEKLLERLDQIYNDI